VNTSSNCAAYASNGSGAAVTAKRAVIGAPPPAFYRTPSPKSTKYR